MLKSLRIELPGWLDEMSSASKGILFENDTDKMRLVIDAAMRNVDSGTGGPFGAGVFDEQTGQVIALGVNSVVAQKTSIAHAEVLAIALAQQRLGTFDLANDPQKHFSLFCSAQPCIMCFGTTWWSGISRLVTAARGADVERITGFDEGPVPEDWSAMLADRRDLPHVEVVKDVLREEATGVLQKYADLGHPVYNAGSTRQDS